MERSEWDAWKAVTAASESRWNLDEVQLVNHGNYLYYHGGADGQYVWVEKDGTVTMGSYTGALPHIGEALFTPIGSAKMGEDAPAAILALLEKFSHPANRDLVTLRVALSRLPLPQGV